MIDGTIGRNGQRLDSTDVNIISIYINHTNGQLLIGMELNKMDRMNQIYQMLDYKNSIDIQEKGKQLARKITDLSLLITPPASPSVWEQCAIILSEKTDDELVPYLTSILQWLYDLNWPGALTILNRLKNFSGKQLKKSFIDSVVRAINSHDEEEGMMWLDYLSELLDNKELKKELPEEILNILEKHYNNWGYWRNEI